jgi:hypothetical protein
MKYLLESSQRLGFTDAYDVFYVDSLEIIKQKFIGLDTYILWSTENGVHIMFQMIKYFMISVLRQNTNISMQEHLWDTETHFFNSLQIS